MTLVLGALATCGALDTFSITRSGTTVVPGGTLLDQLVGELGFSGLGTMNIRDSQELKNQGVSPNQIDSVRLVRITLTITDPPSGQDFSFLQQVAFYAEGEGLPRQKIAEGGPFPAGATQVDLDVLEVELGPYATAPSMSITSSAQGHRPSQATTIRAEVQLAVNVNVSGLICGD